MGGFYFVSSWYQFCLMELTPLLTRNYAKESFTSSPGENKILSLDLLLKPRILNYIVCGVHVHKYL